MAEEDKSEGAIDQNHPWGGSEEIPDIKCTTCGKNELTKLDNPGTAIVFCCECHGLLCKRCLQCHGIFSKNHTLENVSPFHATQKCQDHPEELLETYCKDHKVAICHICEVEKHSECQNLHKLREAAEEMDDQEPNVILLNLKRVSKNIDEALANTKKSVFNLAAGDSKGKIEDLHKQLVEAAGNWKKQALGELEKREKTLQEEKVSIVKELEKSKSEVKEIVGKFDYNTSSKGDLFCYVKKGKRIIDQIDQPPRQELRVIKVVSNIGNVVKAINNTALIADGVDNQETSKLMTKANIKTREDKNTCHVTDMCQLSSGEFLIADFKNIKVKQLNSLYQPMKSLELPAPPKALCEVRPGLVAVSMDSKTDKIMLLDISENKIEKIGVSNNEIKNETEGIVSFDGQLYICEKMYGMYGLYTVSSQIGIYDTKGKQIRKLAPSQLSHAFNIKSDINEHVAHISDNKKNQIVTIALNGNILMTTNCGSSIRGPMGLCRGRNGDIFVAGHDSSSIGLLTTGGIKLQLSESDGLKNPRALCYDMLNDKLLVGCDDSDFIHVYAV